MKALSLAVASIAIVFASAVAFADENDWSVGKVNFLVEKYQWSFDHLRNEIKLGRSEKAEIMNCTTGMIVGLHYCEYSPTQTTSLNRFELGINTMLSAGHCGKFLQTDADKFRLIADFGKAANDQRLDDDSFSILDC